MKQSALTPIQLAAMVDHALLQPFLTLREIGDGCLLAKKLGCASVCVRPSDVKAADKILAASGTLVSTVIGFPHGTTSPEAKKAEAGRALQEGARELDMVLNIGRLKSGDVSHVKNDIETVVKEANKGGAIVKVIFEICFLTDQEIITACAISAEAGAAFIKTSTGFGPSGADLRIVKLMRANSPAHMRIKASGGIKTLEQVLSFYEAGCSRFGCSGTEKILEEFGNR